MISASSQSKHRDVFLVVLLGAAVSSSACRGRARPATTDAAPSDTLVTVTAPSNLEGIVEDRDGVAIPDALIIAWPKGKRGEGIAQARSTEEGRFLLPGLRAGRWSLLVEAGGIATLDTEREVPSDGSAVLMLDGRCRTLTGVVELEGRRQAGALVTLASSSLRWTRSATSDVNGLFTIGGLGNGRFTLRAMLGTRASPAAVVTIDEALVRAPHVRLSLQSGTFVEGKVVDDTGRVVVDATVDVTTMPSGDLPVSSQSGRDGRFRIGPVAPGKYQILARHEGHVLMNAPEPQLGARAVESFDLRLARTARVAGRVLDEEGKPMAAVPVFAMSLVGGHDEWMVVPGPLPLAAEAAELPVGQLARPGGARSAATDGNGRFSIDGLSPGRARIEILHPGKLPLRHEPLFLVPGEGRDVGDLTLSTGATLAGKVVDEQGQSVEGALVEAKLAGRLVRPSVRVTTDLKGEFFLRVPLGEYQLTAQTETLLLPAPLSIHVQSDIATDACVLRLTARAPKTSLRH
jgi:protocatechuate 3,4-dioxygenase beta subunit